MCAVGPAQSVSIILSVKGSRSVCLLSEESLCQVLARCAPGRVGMDLPSSYSKLQHGGAHFTVEDLKIPHDYTARAVQGETAPQEPIILILGVSS